MRLRRPYYITATIAFALSVTACSSEPTPTPDATPTISTTSSPSPEPSVTTSPEPDISVEPEDIAILINDEIDDELMSATHVEDVITTYTTMQLDPYFMSGAWSTEDGSKFAEVFTDIISDELTNEISNIGVTSHEESRIVSSLAAVFQPTEKVKAPDTCNEDIGFQGCLASDVTITNIEVSSSDVNDETVRINFTMGTSRLLDIEGTMSLAGVSYENSLWYDTEARHIVSVQNSFTFDKIAK